MFDPFKMWDEMLDIYNETVRGSKDETVKVARELGLELFIHNRNYGYGANQKTCYREALRCGADIIVMVHPDYQYDPRVVPFALGFLATDICDVVLGWDSNDQLYDNVHVTGWHTGYPDAQVRLLPETMRLLPMEDNLPLFL